MKKAAQSIGTAVVTVGLVAGTSFACDNPNVKSTELCRQSTIPRPGIISLYKVRSKINIRKLRISSLRTYGSLERRTQNQLRKAKSYAAYAKA